LLNRLVRTRMLGGVRGRGLGAPSYSIARHGRLLGGESAHRMPCYSLADAKAVFQELDQWLRGRLRACAWVRWKRVRTRWRALRALGMHEWLTRITANSRRGPWFMAGTPLNQVLNLEDWHKQGLIGLTARYLALR